ncbi:MULTISPECIES: radical SAM/SPASM domain-containing protein [Pseudomonas]|uniref:SPASM domain-containing protein n=1 Tax=Pseudomonas TaxID=286 RepID=UPI0012E0373F|nr:MULTISPECIES: radical SAM/SPASM domain-containing protein [Pseudomonas]
MAKKELDIIWNVTLVCPWDCEFCCTDAVHVSSQHSNIIVRESSLHEISIVGTVAREKFEEKYPGIKPSKFDLALISRQMEGKEPIYEEKIKIIENLKGNKVKIDFAGGDPLACHENYLVIKEASKVFGKDAISITSTGVFVKKYGVKHISEIIGEYEFTYDEPAGLSQEARPAGYNNVNIKIAAEFAKHGVRTKAQVPIHLGNAEIEKINRIYSDLCDMSINELLLMRTFPVGRGQKYLQAHKLNKLQLMGAIQHFKKIEDRSKTNIRLQCALKHTYEDLSKKENPCDLMHESYGINFRGDLLLSAWANNEKGLPISDDFVLGNLCSQSFKEISNSEKFRRYEKRLDENFGHCKVFAYLATESKSEDALFQKRDPLYAEDECFN